MVVDHKPVTTDIKKDFLGQGLVIRREQDASEIVTLNQLAQSGDIKNELRWGKRYASVPKVVLEQWIAEGVDYRLISKDPAMLRKFKQKLEDPEWRALRTHTGNL